MAAISSIIAAAGLGLAAAGTYMQYSAAKSQSQYQSQAIAAQQRAEDARRRAMELDSMRRRREMVRSMIASRAQSESVAGNQGALLGSGLPGAYAGISGRTGVNSLGVTQNTEIGGQIFDANASASGAYRMAAEKGSTAALGQGLTSLGGAALQNSTTIGKIGTYVSSKFTA